MAVLRFYSKDAFHSSKINLVLNELKKINATITSLKTELCYHVEVDVSKSEFGDDKVAVLQWILKEPQQVDLLSRKSAWDSSVANGKEFIIEIGPRFNFSTADSTNSVSICQNAGLHEVKRLEKSIRYYVSANSVPTKTEINEMVDILGDRMTQCRYTAENLPIKSFDEQLPKKTKSDDWYLVPVLSEGRTALEKVNNELGLAFDKWDLEYYLNLFKNVLGRDPTSVELFDLAQSNSEHSRHWFFKGKMIIDGVEHEKSLIHLIIETQKNTNQNNTIKFSDNSSAIKGFTHKTIRPVFTTTNGSFDANEMNIVDVKSDLIFTAETHNMPTAVAPFSGATTGTGGRLRDVQGVGRGGLAIAGTAGYCVGNLNIPDYDMPYESKTDEYPPSFAAPLKILIEASNGASDYGNKFGEPVICGFAMTYGVTSKATKQREEYVKPIMFSGGLGTMDASHRQKLDPSRGNLMAKIGGPVYRIGVGGGAASSVEVQGDNSAELDFNAVQRGDAEMENKLNRVVRACIEMGDRNPILAIHDQGAGGNGNVLKELVEPGYAGAVIFTKEFQLGDPTINVLELWGAEYQENDAILCKPEDRPLLEAICARERCPISFVGVVTGDGYVTLIESEAKFEKYLNETVEKRQRTAKTTVPFDMHLKDILGEMPRKEYNLTTEQKVLVPLELDFLDKTDVSEPLKRVLSLVGVGSKRFLTNKVDRCVTGLIAQQQCIGPLHTPLADFACTTVSHFTYEGIATSIGMQPTKGVISAKANARMSVAEAISNLAFVKVSELADVKCSGNWMWAAKLPGEGAKMYEACQAMCNIMSELNIAVDGGKDSLSMAARIKGDTIKSPGTLVISAYAPCKDVRVKVTPDFKSPALFRNGEIVWVNIENRFRLGGSALAQAYAQEGNDTPDISQPQILKKAFNATQSLLAQGQLLAGHDISDGGLIVALLEMAFGGLCGFQVDLTDAIRKIGTKNFLTNNLTETNAPVVALFAEETGWLLEVSPGNLNTVLQTFQKEGVPVYHIGQSTGNGIHSEVLIKYEKSVLLEGKTLTYFKQWERTSFELEKLQANVACIGQEYATYDYRTGPQYTCNVNPDQYATLLAQPTDENILVAVIREEGTNGDREMIASLIQSNFTVHDVVMNDLLQGKVTLDRYRGVLFPGGFSYADTNGSAKGWAATIIHNESLRRQFLHFKKRSDTFSLGVCNGCQLMSLLGWVGVTEPNANDVNAVPDIALLENKSERFECRWSTLKIQFMHEPVMLKNMNGMVLGCWIAHHEGRFSFRTDNVFNEILAGDLAPIRYVDDNGRPTETYPMNPNGSVQGIAALCSSDGRHLAMMPHPERCTQMFQWPYVSPTFEFSQAKYSPWKMMFDNAFNWCQEHLMQQRFLQNLN
ncbi:phosphoribosylformylglycinamidine synthase [Contarinia nasturtii]|uniref:phosphoribosylformylglycinamidine synthase n=1 Tax=Contarinia nasturtii TaxID=265458 RepID=UPI0012D38789|nr:phosphoribosylformylglycinamidine synthase [Contarinia nasturtii]XP_031616971.1 phosphoribosylformylglycinamidine synthase [Contarinia nasturtii]